MNDAPLTLFDDDLQPARFHPSDPWTSKAAARTVRAGTARYDVLEVLDDVAATGATAFEVAGRLGCQTTSAGTRLGELVDDGYARIPGGTRQTDTGRPARIYTITAAGVDALAAARRAGKATNRPQRRRSGTKPAGRTLRRVPSRYGLTDVADRILEELDAALWYNAVGRTDEELGEYIGILRTHAGTTRKHLADAGLVAATDRVRSTRSGRPAVIHSITGAGIAALDAAKARAAPSE